MDAYTKSTELWWHLNSAEQLAINDPAYRQIMGLLANCLTVVETVQHQLEQSAD